MKGFRSVGRLFAFLGFLGLAGLALAQGAGYELMAYRVDTGGQAAVAGGNYSLRATLGQPDAGRLSGGVYALTGGLDAGSGPSRGVPNPTPAPSTPPANRIWLPFAVRQ